MSVTKTKLQVARVAAEDVVKHVGRFVLETTLDRHRAQREGDWTGFGQFVQEWVDDLQVRLGRLDKALAVAGVEDKIVQALARAGRLTEIRISPKLCASWHRATWHIGFSACVDAELLMADGAMGDNGWPNKLRDALRRHLVHLDELPGHLEIESSLAVADVESRATDDVAAPNIPLEARALGLLAAHPEWPVVKFAEVLGVNRTTLYGLPRFNQAIRAMRGNAPPRGSKIEGRVEAVDDRD